ncbi:unnamed protein product [Blepharisma stoltei]|uniref:Uncharacterized protein n=1 Tax=Blepharisma stoltei TaxID=1481888 RepID=A0AAU9K6Q5_9CILI|nr:unnamed protein product [Blepharisma stoltei]
MSIKPIFDCLLCCDEKLILKKISHDTLQKYTDYQYKPFIANFHPISSMEITPVPQNESRPIPKLNHWSYFKRKKETLQGQIAQEVVIEKSMIRKDMTKTMITYEEKIYDIYEPEFSSDEEKASLNIHENSQIPVRSQLARKPKKTKKKSVQRKTMLQAFVKSLGRFK